MSDATVAAAIIADRKRMIEKLVALRNATSSVDLHLVKAILAGLC
jgi:hypothetical protein